jgi:hypothetical protein
MNTDMDLFELVLFDVLIVLIFLCMLLTAVFFTGHNLFLILLSFTFGMCSYPFAGILGGWMADIKEQEREKLHIPEITIKNPLRWVLLDAGKKGNAWIFRIISVVTAVSGLYNLVMYLIG